MTATTRKPLEGTQHRAMLFISGYIFEYGYPPTVREIGAYLRLSSTSSTNYILKQLQRKGYISRRANIPRSIQVIPAGAS